MWPKVKAQYTLAESQPPWHCTHTHRAHTHDAAEPHHRALRIREHQNHKVLQTASSPLSHRWVSPSDREKGKGENKDSGSGGKPGHKA